MKKVKIKTEEYDVKDDDNYVLIVAINNLAADSIHKYRKIYIDDGGIGSGVVDPLLQHSQTRRRILPFLPDY